jgi:hypothetical protein
MLEIRYSAPYDLEISATVGEWQMVRREILDLIQSDAIQNSIEADSAIDPAPYHSALSKLIIMKGQGPVRISLKDEIEILVEGSTDCLEGFASFFEFESDAEKGTHSHFDYYEGNNWIAPDSIPLVIRVKSTNN